MSTTFPPRAPLPHRRRGAVPQLTAAAATAVPSHAAAGPAGRAVPAVPTVSARAAVPVPVSAPTTVRVDRITVLALLLVAALTGGMLVAGRPGEEALLAALVFLVAVHGAVFCLRAVTVTGFLAGAAGAALVLTGPVSLVVALVVAGALALVCGVAPAWRRVEVWQSGRTALAGAGPSQAGRLWRADRVGAAFLVLSFPPAMAAFGEFFIAWSTSR